MSNRALTPEHLAYMRVNQQVAQRVADALQIRSNDLLTQAQAEVLFPSLVLWNGRVHEFSAVVSSVNESSSIMPSEVLLQFSTDDLRARCRFKRSVPVWNEHQLTWIADISMLRMCEILDLHRESNEKISGFPGRVRVNEVGLRTPEPGGEELFYRELLARSPRTTSKKVNTARWGLVYKPGLTPAEYAANFFDYTDSLPTYTVLAPNEVAWWLITESLAHGASVICKNNYHIPYRCIVNDALKGLGVVAVTVARGSEWPLKIEVTYWGSDNELEAAGYRWAVAQF